MRRLVPLIPLGLSLVFVISWFGQGVDARSSGGAAASGGIVLGSPVFRSPSTASEAPSASAPVSASPSEAPSFATEVPSAVPTITASPVTQQLCVSVTGAPPAGGWTVQSLIQALLGGTAFLTDVESAIGCAPVASPSPAETLVPSAAPTIPPLPTSIATLAPLPTPVPTPVPTPAATPTPTPTANSAVQQPGTIWFGTSNVNGVLRGHRSTFRPGQKIAVSAFFSQSPNASKVTLTLFTGANDRVVFSQVVTIGVDWQGLAITIVRPLGVGRYHLQISHGGTLLSDGRFTVK